MWDLAAKTEGSGFKWREMFRKNVEAGLLRHSDSVHVAKDTTIVWLEPGDYILLGANAAAMAPQQVEKVDPAKVFAPAVTVVADQSSATFNWLLAILAIVAVIAFWYAYQRRREQRAHAQEITDTKELRRTDRETSALLRVELAELQRPRSPAETFSNLEVISLATGYRRQRSADEAEGPSFIDGGIRSPETLALALQRAAQVDDVRRNPEAPLMPHTRYVFRQGKRGKVVAGTYSSLFADGTERVRVIERDKPETHRYVWKATAVSPNGSDFDTYAEETCANGMAIPVIAQGDLVWEEVPQEERTYSLPASAMYVEPTPVPAPAAPIEMMSVIQVTTPAGHTFHFPSGSSLSPMQIPASEMVPPPNRHGVPNFPDVIT